MSQHAVYLREWRSWRRVTIGQCEAICSGWQNGHHGQRCTFAGAWCGVHGLVLCRVHERRFDEATNFPPYIRDCGERLEMSGD